MVSMYELSSCSIKPLIFFCTSHPTLLFMVLFFTRACALFLSLFIWLITAPPFIYITVRISSYASADPWGGWWVNGKCHLKIDHPQSLPLPRLTQLVPWSNQQKWARQQKSDDTGTITHSQGKCHVFEMLLGLPGSLNTRDTRSYCLWKGRKYFCIKSRCENTHMHIHTFS